MSRKRCPSHLRPRQDRENNARYFAHKVHVVVNAGSVLVHVIKVATANAPGVAETRLLARGHDELWLPTRYLTTGRDAAKKSSN